MGVEQALARGRAAAARLMVDACTIERQTGETTTGGVITPTYSPVYTGKCRLQVQAEAGQGTDVGEAYRIVRRIVLSLPFVTATEQLLEGDRVTMTAASLDASLVGRRYTLRDVLAKTHATARRATLLEVTS